MGREINLLPPERRRALEKQAELTALRTALRSILMGLLLVTLAGGVSLTIVTSMAAAEKRIHGDGVEEKTKELRALRDEIALDNERLELMAKQTNERVLWSDRLQELFEVLPPGVQIELLQGSDQPPLRQLVFSGTAVTRNALIILEKRLQELDWVERVEAPVSNLVRRTEAGYTFTVRIKAPERESVE